MLDWCVFIIDWKLYLKPVTQLSLPISLPDNETFASFYVGGNQSLLENLRQALHNVAHQEYRFFYLWSNQCAGRTHLLHAACAEITEQSLVAAYIPLKHYRELSPEILEGLEYATLVCLDDLEQVMGSAQWELAIFNLYNRMLEAKGCLIVTANHSPQSLPVVLADLSSRLQWGYVYYLKPLNDVEKLKALQWRAQLRGFDLADDVGHFLLKRINRDLRSLFLALDKLDIASIAAQRKLTIPFVKLSLGL